MANKTTRASFDPNIFLSKVGEGKTILEYRKDQIVFAQGDVADTVYGDDDRTHLENSEAKGGHVERGDQGSTAKQPYDIEGVRLSLGDSALQNLCNDRVHGNPPSVRMRMN
jgi:hypothetical protein